MFQFSQTQHIIPLQRLMQTQKMQQALTVLSLPSLELKLLLEEQLKNNPLVSSIATTPLPLLDTLPAKPSPKEELTQKLKARFPSQAEALTSLVGFLEDSGLLTTPLEEIADHTGLSTEKLQEAKETLQSVEPKGLGASSFQELLLLQVEPTSVAHKLLKYHFSSLLKKEFKKICRSLALKPEELQKLLHEEIRPLHTRCFPLEETPCLPKITDCKLHEDGTCEVSELLAPFTLEEEKIPLYEQPYKELLWIQDTLAYRNYLLLRLASFLYQEQRLFLEGKLVVPKPLSVTPVAEALEIHPSTLYRLLQEKRIETVQGTLNLSAFFSAPYTKEHSRDFVLRRIEHLITQEEKPLTDGEIAKLLKQEGVPISRRTVCKLRQEKNIPPSHKRKS